MSKKVPLTNGVGDKVIETVESGLPNCTDTNINTYSNDPRKQCLALFNDEDPFGIGH